MMTNWYRSHEQTGGRKHLLVGSSPNMGQLPLIVLCWELRGIACWVSMSCWELQGMACWESIICRELRVIACWVLGSGAPLAPVSPALSRSSPPMPRRHTSQAAAFSGHARAAGGGGAMCEGLLVHHRPPPGGPRYLQKDRRCEIRELGWARMWPGKWPPETAETSPYPPPQTTCK
eukprot:gene12081-biopygen3405